MKANFKKLFNSNLSKIVACLIICTIFFILIISYKNYQIHKLEKVKIEKQKHNKNNNKENQKMKEEKEKSENQKETDLEKKKIDLDEREIDNFNEKKPK